MILVDSSVWVDHFRGGDARLMKLLGRREVFMHPYVIGELACGSLANRAETLELLAGLPMADAADPTEVVGYIERHGLHGRGIGYVDVHLLMSAALTDGTRLWTHDRRLHAAALSLGCADPAISTH